MQSLNDFALEAVRYANWATGVEGADPITPRNALLRLSNLYQAALHLPSPWTKGLQVDEPKENHTLEDFNLVMANAQNFPFRGYSEIFDPFADPTEEPVLADVAADIAEIYEDIIWGLRKFEAGQVLEARYQWGWGFQHHWGEHATAAIRAIHSYLSQNACDELTREA